MCKLSNQLKLCTCDVGSVDRLEHYWVLHRFDPRKDDSVIGRLFMPHTLDGRVEAYNRSLLLQRLQEGDAFDVDLKPREGDRLQLTFRCSEADASGARRARSSPTGMHGRPEDGWRRPSNPCRGARTMTRRDSGSPAGAGALTPKA